MRRQLISVLPIVFLFAGNFCRADVIIVDANGSADYTAIQDAIDESGGGDTIEVRPGVYYESLNFYGKAITITGTDPNNINTVYATVVDGGSQSGNTVTFDSGEDGDSIITGLTIQNGSGGVSCYYSDPLISKCVIRYVEGMGIYGSDSSPSIYDCIISENSNYGIRGCDGPITDCSVHNNSSYGIYACDGPITDCIVTENRNSGLFQCLGSISGCIISANLSYGLDSCNGQIVNCIVSGNTYSGLSNCNTHIENCTIIGNKGSGIYFGGSTGATVVNNIIVKNWTYGISIGVSNSTLKYNNLWGNLSGNYNGGAPGETDTHENPLFAVDGYWDGDDEWVEGEYYLKSIAGRWDPNGQIWVNDEVTSPCIDAGEPAGGHFYEPAPNGGRVNQGAYGGTIW